MKNMVMLEKIGCLLTLQGAALKQGRRVQEADLGILEKPSLIFADGVIQWIGPHSKIPKEFFQKKIKTIKASDWTILPGFVEGHTHSIFAGSRSAEFEMRQNGKTYQQIAAQGGGILSTVKATRAASEQSLLTSTQARVDEFTRQGVSTLEIKTGYALDLKNEIKCLQLLKKITGPEIVSTYLGAHAIPPEFKSETDYLQFMTEKVLPIVASKKLAERVDIFIEKGFFSVDSSRIFLQKAQALGLQITIHADQLSLSGGTELAIDLRALSADHVIQLQEKQIQKISRSEMTAVLLPAVDLYMRCAYPPARKLIEAGARVALATDFNPGTCPTQDLSLVGLLARLEMKMTLPEVISAYTVGASYALNRSQSSGSLEFNKHASFLCTKKSWTDLFYSVGSSSTELVYSRGKEIYAAHSKI
jgi:imidazolonepropionase